MNKLFLITFLSAMAACATPVSEPTRSDSERGSRPDQASLSDQASAPDQAAESGSDDWLTQSDSAEKSEGIEELEAPDVSETPAEMIPGNRAPEPAIVCERVVPTGSVLAVEVCRDKSEIARKQTHDQEIFDDIKRQTAIGNTRL